MKEQLEQIKAKALADLAAAADMPALDAVRVRVLGKKGELTAVLKQMGKLSAEERPVMGQRQTPSAPSWRRHWRSAAPRWMPPRSRQSSRPRPWMSPSPASPWKWATSTR